MYKDFMAYVRRTWVNKLTAIILLAFGSIIVNNYGGVPMYSLIWWWGLLALMFLDNKSWF